VGFLSKNICQVEPSSTLAVAQGVRRLRGLGREVIDLGVGEPDFGTPENVKQAAIKAIREGKTRYVEVNGIPELKSAIVSKFKEQNDIEYQASEIIVSSGCKQVLFNALMATINPGDEVLIPVPYWVTYPEIVRLVGGVPVFIDTNPADGFKVNPNELENAITMRTKWLIFNSPSNPSGSVYTASEIRSLMEVIARHPHVWVLSDDIYEHFVYDGFAFSTPAQVFQDLRHRILTVNGVSKAYAMTGWRIGYCGGPEPLIKAMGVLQGHATSHPCSVSQWAAVEALNSDQGHVERNNQLFRVRRDMIVPIINQSPGLSCDVPRGSFYVYVSCAQLIGKGLPSGKRIGTADDFAEMLLEATGVAVVGGAAFGHRDHFRISYALDDRLLKRAGEFIRDFCSNLH